MITTDQIPAFYDQGNDALNNMFEMLFFGNGGSVPGDISEDLKYRVTAFSLPEKNVNTYDKWYKGHKITTPSGLDGDPKTATFTFRVAKNVKFYKAMRAWAEICKSVPDINSQIRSDLTIYPIDQDDADTSEGGWTLKGMFPTNVQGISFDQNSGEPVAVQVTVAYFKCLEQDAALGA